MEAQPRIPNGPRSYVASVYPPFAVKSFQFVLSAFISHSIFIFSSQIPNPNDNIKGTVILPVVTPAASHHTPTSKSSCFIDNNNPKPYIGISTLINEILYNTLKTPTMLPHAIQH